MKDEKLFEGIDKKAFTESLKEENRRKIILKYLFLKSIEKEYADEYIKTKYRINPKTIREQYEGLDKEEIAVLESELKAKIQKGIINLQSEAVNWHRESFSSKKKPVNDTNRELTLVDVEER